MLVGSLFIGFNVLLLLEGKGVYKLVGKVEVLGDVFVGMCVCV